MIKLICIIVFLTLGSIFCLFSIIHGLDKIEYQRQQIASLETKVMWLEDKSVYMLAIKAMSGLERDELKAMNELIKQGKRK